MAEQDVAIESLRHTHTHTELLLDAMIIKAGSGLSLIT